MEYQEASSEVQRILSADLGSLTHREGVSVHPPAALSAWRISARDKEALSVHGLPSVPSDGMLMRFGASFQPSSEPEYMSYDWSGYVIGQCGDVRIVVNEASGSVIAVPEVRNLVPALAHLHPDGIQDEMINSGAAAFVDFCWRWYWLAPILVDQRDRADRAEVAAWEAARKSSNKAERIDFHVPYRELCSKVRDKFYGKDQLSLSNPESMWSMMIDGFE
ncbi:SUKH-4 family immunity protein [Streptomyces sp. NPDC050743]|uniref:SUKH-4 family immunity protein n=1 Tax=Streptomyces sp. NPDC050743 TaxID=3365634 RepID=UPI003799DF50